MIVLIDTWWNVNKIFDIRPNTSIVVLIDTWWNVNNKSQTFSKENGFGFNRYMVECESSIRKSPCNGWYGFNRYMVECE